MTKISDSIYSSYNDFINKNIGEKKIVISVGSGGTSQPLEGATKESLEKAFKDMIFHEFKDGNFSSNYCPDEYKKEYSEFINKFYNELITNDNLFVDFWSKYMMNSGRYNSKYSIVNPHYTREGKSVDYKGLEHYPDSIFYKYKNEMSSGLKKSYVEYMKEYADKDINLNKDIEIDKMEKGGEIKINSYSVKNWSEIPTVWKNTKEVKKVKYTNSPFDKELLNMLSSIAGDDNLRPVMSGVNFDDFGITVTNAHVLVSIPEPNEKYKGTYATIPKKDYIINKGSGVEIKNNMFVSPKYPQYKEIIRGSKKSDRVQKINVYKLLQWTEVALKYCNKGSFTVFYWMGDTSMAFNANYVLDSMKLLLKLGYSEVYCFTSEGNKAAIFSPDKDYEIGKSLILLLMPVMIDDKIYKIEDIKGGSFDLDFSRELLAYYDFSTDEIRNSNDSVAEFKMFYGDYDVLPQNEIKMLNKFSEKNTYPILDFFAVRNNHIHASDLASSLLIKHTDLEDGLYDVLDGAIELNEEMNSDEYPLAIKIEEPKIKFIIGSDVLYHYISIALKFVSKDDLRPQLTGIFFDYKDGKMFIVATNAHILGKIDITKYIEVNKDQVDFNFIVNINNLTKFFNNIEDSAVIVSADKNNVSFENEKYTFTSRLIEAKYSNYEGVISNFNEKKLNLSKKELLDCINSDEAKKFIKEHKREKISIFDEPSSEGRLDIYLGTSDDYNRESATSSIKEKIKVGNISYGAEEGTYQIIDSAILIMPMAIENVNLFAFDVKYLGSVLDSLNCDSFDFLYKATNRGYFITGSCLNYGTEIKPISSYKEVVKVSKNESEIEELEMLIDLLKEVVAENPKDLDSKDVLELYEENLIELKKVNSDKFSKGGKISDYHDVPYWTYKGSNVSDKIFGDYADAEKELNKKRKEGYYKNVPETLIIVNVPEDTRMNIPQRYMVIHLDKDYKFDKQGMVLSYEKGGSVSSELDEMYNHIGNEKPKEIIVESEGKKIKYNYLVKNPTYYVLEERIFHEDNEDHEGWEYISSYGSPNAWDVKHAFRWEMNNVLGLPNYEKGGGVGCGCSHSYEEGGEIKKKKVIRRNLPINKEYKLVDSFYTGGIMDNPMSCENCGRPIANVAVIEDEDGKKYDVGMDCAETLSQIKNSLEFNIAQNDFNEANAIRTRIRTAFKKNPNAILEASNTYTGTIHLGMKDERGRALNGVSIPKDFFFKYLPEFKNKISNPEKNNFRIRFDSNYKIDLDANYFKKENYTEPKSIIFDSYKIVISRENVPNYNSETGEIRNYNDTIVIKIFKSDNLIGERKTYMVQDISLKIIYAINEYEFENYKEEFKNGGYIQTLSYSEILKRLKDEFGIDESDGKSIHGSDLMRIIQVDKNIDPNAGLNLSKVLTDNGWTIIKSNYEKGGGVGFGCSHSYEKGGSIETKINVRRDNELSVFTWTISEMLNHINEDKGSRIYTEEDWMLGFREKLKRKGFSLIDSNGRPLNNSIKNGGFKDYDNSFGEPLELPKSFYLNGKNYTGKAIFVKGKRYKTDGDFVTTNKLGFLMTPSSDIDFGQDDDGDDYLTDKDGYGIRSISRRGMVIMINDNSVKIFDKGGSIESNDSKYFSKTFESKGNTWNILFVWGRFNYVSVSKKTNNPFGSGIGKEFKNVDEAIAYYKNPDMKVQLIFAENEAKELGYVPKFENGGSIKSTSEELNKEAEDILRVGKIETDIRNEKDNTRTIIVEIKPNKEYALIVKKNGNVIKLAKGQNELSLLLNKDKYENGGGIDDMSVQFIEYNGQEIMFEPHDKKYYSNDEEFTSLEEAKKYIDNGSKLSSKTINAYRHGAFEKGGQVGYKPLYYATYDDNNLGILLLDENGNKKFEILHASVLRGSNYNPLTGSRIDISDYNYGKIKKASEKDFDIYRVSLPSDFHELNNPSKLKEMIKKGDIVTFKCEGSENSCRGEVLDVLSKDEYLISKGIKSVIIPKDKVIGIAPAKINTIFDRDFSIYDERVMAINSTYFYKTYGVGENPFEVNYEGSNEYGYGIYFLDKKCSGIGKYNESRILAIKPNVKKPLIFLNDDGSSFNSQYKEAYEKAIKYDGVKNKDDFNKKMVELGYDSMLVSDIHGTHLIFFYNDPNLYTVKSDVGN